MYSGRSDIGLSGVDDGDGDDDGGVEDPSLSEHCTASMNLLAGSKGEE